MVIEIEHPTEPSGEISRIHDATHTLYGYAKAVNGPEAMPGIEGQLDILIEELRNQIIEHFRATLGKKLSLEDEEELRGLVEGLDALVRKNVTNEATDHDSTAFGNAERPDNSAVRQIGQDTEPKIAA